MENNIAEEELQTKDVKPKKTKKNVFQKVKKFFNKIGPGFVTGCADDDSSGIGTYSVAGAKYGYQMTWLVLYLAPAMISIQEMCGRIGMVSGKGLAGVIKKYYSKKILYFAVFLLAIANIINIGADLGIMAASIQMLWGKDLYMWLGIVAVGIVLMEVFIPYKIYSKYLKWLGLSLCVYIITVFMVKQNWQQIALSTFIPSIQFNSEYIMTIIGFVGTTISPYLFFWQSSAEIEDKIVEEKVKDFGYKPRIKLRDIKKMRNDTNIGMIFSNMIAFFIILTTAATLHAQGIFNIQTVQEAALSLKPLAGQFAYLLFAIGIIGIGWQAIPVLAASVGYALSETFGAEEGLSKPFLKAKVFYIIIAVSTLIGVAINYLHINIIQALVYAAVVNGIASIPLIAIIIKLSSDKRVVGEYKTKPLNKIIAWITFLFMTFAVLFMLYTMIF